MAAPTLGETRVWTGPGVYDLTNAEYHADELLPGGSLSSTGARKLLAPSCPALFKWEREHPRPFTKALDTGSAAHDMLLGGGPEIVVIPDEITAKNGSWSTDEAKAMVADVRGRDAVPMKPAEYDEVKAIVAAVRAHPIAGRLFEPGAGVAEPSLFWTDEVTGVQRRARLDWLPHRTGRRTIIADLKTTRSAQRDKFAKSAQEYGYHQQAAYYLDAVNALDLADDPVFVFVAIEKTPPYLVNVIQLDPTAMRIGAYLNRRALAIYAECTRTGHWPGYSNDVEQVSLPGWYERSFDNEDI
jgi:hypothetical protein